MHASFPGPARDHLDSQLDFNELMIRRLAATYVLRAEGQSMVKGDFLVKRLQTSPCMQIIAMSDDNPDIELSGDQQLEIFGVVTFVVKPMLEGVI